MKYGHIGTKRRNRYKQADFISGGKQAILERFREDWRRKRGWGDWVVPRKTKEQRSKEMGKEETGLRELGRECRGFVAEAKKQLILPNQKET